MSEGANSRHIIPSPHAPAVYRPRDRRFREQVEETPKRQAQAPQPPLRSLRPLTARHRQQSNVNTSPTSSRSLHPPTRNLRLEGEDPWLLPSRSTFTYADANTPSTEEKIGYKEVVDLGYPDGKHGPLYEYDVSWKDGPKDHEEGILKEDEFRPRRRGDEIRCQIHRSIIAPTSRP